jgi:hypothetical protein
MALSVPTEPTIPAISAESGRSVRTDFHDSVSAIQGMYWNGLGARIMEYRDDAATDQLGYWGNSGDEGNWLCRRPRIGRTLSTRSSDLHLYVVRPAAVTDWQIIVRNVTRAQQTTYQVNAGVATAGDWWRLSGTSNGLGWRYDNASTHLRITTSTVTGGTPTTRGITAAFWGPSRNSATMISGIVSGLYNDGVCPLDNSLLQDGSPATPFIFGHAAGTAIRTWEHMPCQVIASSMAWPQRLEPCPFNATPDPSIHCIFRQQIHVPLGITTGAGLTIATYGRKVGAGSATWVQVYAGEYPRGVLLKQVAVANSVWTSQTIDMRQFLYRERSTIPLYMLCNGDGIGGISGWWEPAEWSLL